MMKRCNRYAPAHPFTTHRHMRKICVLYVGIILICFMMFSCSNGHRKIYSVVECTPGIVQSDAEYNTVEVSPQIYDLVIQKANLEFAVIHPYNLRDFFSDEIGNFTYSGLKIEDWNILCYEEGLSYDEYCCRCEQYKEAVDAETSYLHELFYKKTGIKLSNQLENGFYEVKLTMKQLLSLLDSDVVRPSLFICTIEEYQTHFSAPLATPS